MGEESTARNSPAGGSNSKRGAKTTILTWTKPRNQGSAGHTFGLELPCIVRSSLVRLHSNFRGGPRLLKLCEYAVRQWENQQLDSFVSQTKWIVRPPTRGLPSSACRLAHDPRRNEINVTSPSRIIMPNAVSPSQRCMQKGTSDNAGAHGRKRSRLLTSKQVNWCQILSPIGNRRGGQLLVVYLCSARFACRRLVPCLSRGVALRIFFTPSWLC